MTLAFLRGDRVALRPVETDDAAFLAGLVNDPRVREHVGMCRPVPLHDERAWIEDHDGTHLMVTADGEPVGSVGVDEPDEPWGVAEIGYSIVPDAQDGGYATEAVGLLAGYAFDEQRVAKLAAKVYETNPASVRVLEKVGFEREGVLRREAFVEGERVDVYRYGLLAAEHELE